jgi:hypothetical protein
MLFLLYPYRLSKIAFRILVAAKVDDLISANPDLEDEIKQLSESDPSKKGKYLEWSVKQLKQKAKLEDLIPTVEAFHKNQQRLDKKDINQYKSLKELENTIKDLPESKTKQKERIKSEGATKLWESDTHVLFRIDTRDACIQYGKGTKWCITMRAHHYWESYKGGNSVFYFLIDKRAEEEGQKENVDFRDVKTPKEFSKIAWDVRRGIDNEVERVTIFNARDKVITRQSIPGIPEFSHINQIVLEDAPNAPDGPIVSLKKGTISPSDARHYFMSLDDEGLSPIIPYIEPKEELDKPILDRVLKGDLSDSLVYHMTNKICSKSPELDDILIDLSKKNYPVNFDLMNDGPQFDELIRFYLERNPEFFAGNYHGVGWSKPAIDLINRISDPKFRKELSDANEHIVIERATLNEEQIKEYSNSENPNIRKSILINLFSKPDEVNFNLIWNLLKDPDVDVRKAFAEGLKRWLRGQHSGLYKKAVIELLNDPDDEVVAEVAKVNLKEIDDKLLNKLINHPNEKVRASIQSNSSVPEKLKPLSDSSKFVRKAIIINRSVSREQLDEFSKSSDVDKKCFVLEYIKRKGLPGVHSFSSSGRKETREFVQRFLNDENEQIRLLANSVMMNYGGKYDETGFDKSDDPNDVIAWIGSNEERAKLENFPNLEDDGIEHVKRHASVVIKLHELMRYFDGKAEAPKLGYGVEQQVVRLLPKEYAHKVLEKIELFDEKNTVLGLILGKIDKKFYPDVFEKLDFSKWYADVVNKIFKKVDQDFLLKHIDSNKHGVRMAVARNIDESHLPKLIDDSDSNIRRIVAERIDPSHLEEMLKDPNPGVRWAVSKRIPYEHLEKMLRDRSSRVRATVKFRLQNEKGKETKTSSNIELIANVIAFA